MKETAGREKGEKERKERKKISSCTLGCVGRVG